MRKRTFNNKAAIFRSERCFDLAEAWGLFDNIWLAPYPGDKDMIRLEGLERHEKTQLFSRSRKFVN